MHISVISIPVSDPERSKAFYGDALGFEVIADAEFAPGQRWLQLGPPGAQTSITLTTWLEGFDPGGLRGLILEIDDIEGRRSELEGAGVEFTEDTYDTPWGRFAGFVDPDGNRWSLHQP